MGPVPNQAPLVVIVGETAGGKSVLAMELAKQFNGEIICADSRTVYRGMDIGTAKPSKSDQAEISHHILDVVEPDKPFSAAVFKRLALAAIQDIHGRGKLPIMVGGTGLYIDGVLFDYKFSEPGAERDTQNPRHLKKTDQPAAQVLRPNTLVIGVQVERDELERRLTQRVEAMFLAGLEAEAVKMSQMYGPEAPGLQTIGYKELVAEQNVRQAKEQVIKNTKAYAKRQRTWFKRNKSIHWVRDSAAAKRLVQNFLSKPPQTS